MFLALQTEQVDISRLIYNILDALIFYGPKIIGAAIILVVGWAVGRALGRIIYTIVNRMGLSALFQKTSIGRAILMSGYTAAQFFSSLVRWLIYLVAVFAAIDILAVPTLTKFTETVILYVPSFIAGVFVLVVGFIFADWISGVVKQLGAGTTVGYFKPLGEALKIVLYFIFATMALAQMKVDVTILYIFAQALAWAVAIGLCVGLGIAFGWGLRDRVGPLVDQMFGTAEKKTKR